MALQGVATKVAADGDAVEVPIVTIDCWYSVVCQEGFEAVEVAVVDAS